MAKKNKIVNKFREYTTSTAFHISLSENMIEWLFYMKAAEVSGDKVEMPMHVTVATVRSLTARGLLSKKLHKGYPYIQPTKVLCLTPAGHKMCELLEYAGFGIDKYNFKEKTKSLREARM